MAFSRIFSLALVLMMATAVQCKPIRGNLGGEGNEFGGEWEPTAADYIQDGLIAMWDGIENAGWGIHDAESRVWKDLVGEADLSLNYSDVYFTGNSFRSEVRKSMLAGHRMMEELLYPATIEIVFKREASANWTMVLFGTGGQEAPSKRLLTATAQGAVRGHGDGTFPVAQIDVAELNSVTFTYSDASTVSAAFANGIESSVTGWTSWSAASVNLGISTYQNHNYGFMGDIYSIRLYSRELTEQEVYHNALVDKLRFDME